MQMRGECFFQRAAKKRLQHSLKCAASGLVFRLARSIDHLPAALPPPVVASVLAGIEFLEQHPERVRQLHENVRYFVDGLKKLGFEVSCETAIIPVAIPALHAIRQVVSRLNDEGVFVNGIEYPVVPKDKQRLRVSMMATFTREDLDFALSASGKVGREMGMIR